MNRWLTRTILVGLMRWGLITLAFYAGSFGLPGMMAGALVVTLMTPPVRA